MLLPVIISIVALVFSVAAWLGYRLMWDKRDIAALSATLDRIEQIAERMELATFVVAADLTNSQSVVNKVAADVEVIHELGESVKFLRDLIGEPGSDSLNEPLIPYLHRLRHEAVNEKTKDRMLIELQHKTLKDALVVLADMQERIENSAKLAAGVAADLAESQKRADSVIDGAAGEAADAGAKSSA